MNMNEKIVLEKKDENSMNEKWGFDIFWWRSLRKFELRLASTSPLGEKSYYFDLESAEALCKGLTEAIQQVIWDKTCKKW